MNDQQKINALTQFFSWFGGVASYLGISTQDLVCIVVGAVSVLISILSFVWGRIDAANKRRQEERRTAAYENYLRVRSGRPPTSSEDDDATQYTSLPAEESEA